MHPGPTCRNDVWKMRGRLVAGHGHAWFEHICLCVYKRKGISWLTSLMEVRSNQDLGFNWGFFCCCYFFPPSLILLPSWYRLRTWWWPQALQCLQKEVQFPRRGERFFNMLFSCWHDSKTSQLLLLWKLASPSFLLFRPWFKKSLNMCWCPLALRTAFKHVLKVLSCAETLFWVGVLEMSIYMK